MKFTNIHIKNKYVKLENIHAEFDKTGVYLIRGLNGSGKTTLIQQLVFGENQLEANTVEQQEAYGKERYNLISYVPQELYPSSISVRDYLIKDNEQVDSNQMHRYLEMLDICYIDLETQLNKLSGGEVTKLAIISAVLKNTPYLIMDEPTNNLDNSSVSRLCELIEEIQKEKTVIIITHDTRIEFPSCTKLELKDNKLYDITESLCEQETVGRQENVCPPARNKCTSFTRIAGKLQGGLLNYLNYLTVVVVFILLVILNFNDFEKNYGINSVREENIIAVFANGDAQLNETYMKGAHLKGQEGSSEKTVSFSEVPKIAKKDGIEKLYIMDEEYTQKLMGQAEQFKPKKQNIIKVSIPDIIYRNYIQNIGLINFLALETGEAPKEGTDEIALSYRILEKKLGIKPEDVQIGMRVIVEGAEYHLSGVTVNDIGWVPYEEGEKSLYYTYNEETYDEFMKRNATEEGEFYPDSDPHSIMLITKNGMEQRVLNQLFEEYYGNNYGSAVYSKIWIKQHNKEVLKPIFWLNLVIAAAFGIILFINNRSAMKEETARIGDYENYYIYNNHIRKTYVKMKIAIYLCCIILGFVVNGIVNHKYMECSYIFIGIDTCLMMVGVLIQFVNQLRREKK